MGEEENLSGGKSIAYQSHQIELHHHHHVRHHQQQQQQRPLEAKPRLPTVHETFEIVKAKELETKALESFLLWQKQLRLLDRTSSSSSLSSLSRTTKTTSRCTHHHHQQQQLHQQQQSVYNQVLESSTIKLMYNNYYK